MRARNLVLTLVVLAPFVLIAAFVQNIYYLHLFNLMIIYSLFSLGLNILMGFTGITSFGHAGFFAVGVYVAANLTTRVGFPVLPSLLIAAVTTGLVGILISLPVLRISGIYLAMVTLGFSEFFRLLAIYWEAVTGGPLGISRIPAIAFFDVRLRGERPLFFFLYPALILCTVVFVRIVRSRFGQSLRAIKDSERAAASISIPCARNKMVSFFVSGLYSGLAGAL